MDNLEDVTKQIDEYLKSKSFSCDKNIYTKKLITQQPTAYINGQPIQAPPQEFTCKIVYEGDGNIDEIPVLYYTFQIFQNEFDKHVDFEQGIYNFNEFDNIIKNELGL